MKRINLGFIVTLVVISMLCMVGYTGGCGGVPATSKSADVAQAKKTRSMMEEANRQVGMPNITNYQQRKLMKLVYELCDQEKLICYAYIKSDYSGTLNYIGKCVGFGIPFSAQYTNPSRIWDAESEGGAKAKYQDAGEIQVIPQPDPNGLFMPTSSSATWLMMIDPETQEPRPVYLEPEIVVSPFRIPYANYGTATMPSTGG